MTWWHTKNRYMNIVDKPRNISKYIVKLDFWFLVHVSCLKTSGQVITQPLNAFTSYKFTTTLFEEMAFGGQRTVMTVATVITPHTEFACRDVSKKVTGRR